MRQKNRETDESRKIIRAWDGNVTKKTTKFGSLQPAHLFFLRIPKKRCGGASTALMRQGVPNLYSYAITAV